MWHVILFEESNPTGSRPRDLIGLYKQHMKPHPPEHTRKGKGEKENPTGRKEQLGRGEGQQGLHCGEANPNQRLGGTSGQRPSADSQC